MTLTSLAYALFLAVVAIACFLLPVRWQRRLLLLASFGFYASWQVEFAVLLAAATTIDFAAALGMRGATASRRRALLAVSLTSNLGVLALFKLSALVPDLARLLADLGVPVEPATLAVVVPLGLSFSTFQRLGYTISVYLGRHEAERSLLSFALFTSFFPLVVAGPIERAGRLLPQLRRTLSFDDGRVVSGLKLIAWGLFKKLVVADRAAVVADTVFANPQAFTGVQLATAATLYAYQIYCDFSGYSDIAIGSARILGIDLMTNFDRPYAARSVADFWRRWHVSLSTWLRDFLFLPLAWAIGRRLDRLAVGVGAGELLFYCGATAVTMLLCGLWHGLAWTFLAWGGLHAAALVLERLAGRRLRRAPVALMRVWTLSVVLAGWVVFRSATLGDALHVLGNLHSGWGALLSDLFGGSLIAVEAAFRGLGLGQRDFLVLLGGIAALEAVQGVRGGSVEAFLAGRPGWLRWAFYYALAGAIVFLGAFNVTQQFIYQQF